MFNMNMSWSSCFTGEQSGITSKPENLAMATSLINPRLAARIARPATTASFVWRLAAALGVAAGLGLFVVGTAWDIQWHIAVGRDRALTRPHVMMLAGMALAGLVSLLAVLIESWAVWRSGASDPISTRVLGIFYAPLGMVMAGTGALLAVIAFPLDDYWHVLYGIDVTLWAPFHVMIVMGMVMAGVGTLMTLADLMRDTRAPGARLSLEIVFAIVLAMTYQSLLILLPQADAEEGLVRIGQYEFVLYPVLLAVSLPLAVLTAARVTGRPGVATATALVFLGLRQVMFLFVPWAVEVGAAAEGLAFRPNAPTMAVAPFAFPTSILGAALLVDCLMLVMRRRGSSAAWPLPLGVAIAALVAVLWDRPWATVLPLYYFPDLDTTGVLLRALPFAAAAAVAGVCLAGLLSRALVAQEGAR